MAEPRSAQKSPASQTQGRRPFRWQDWWHYLSPIHQARVAILAPLTAVLLFMAACLSAFWFLHAQETRRNEAHVQQDAARAREQLRRHLQDVHRQLLQLARETEASPGSGPAPETFAAHSRTLMRAYPEIMALAFVDASGNVRASQLYPGSSPRYQPGSPLQDPFARQLFSEAHTTQKGLILLPVPVQDNAPARLLGCVPLHASDGQFLGMLLADGLSSALLRNSMDEEITARYAIAISDPQGQMLVDTGPEKTGHSAPPARSLAADLPLELAGNELLLHMRTWHAPPGIIGGGVFWLVGTFSVMTLAMLLLTWVHWHRRMQAQAALIQETNFRRAMENSLHTGMRALDMDYRITNVNPAFCRMTGWSEAELIGLQPPYPFWPDAERQGLHEKLLHGVKEGTDGHNVQVRFQRKDGSQFDARLYTSPLMDLTGTQTGWVTSVTDITGPNRIRDQLSASFTRFTIVLEALDAAVSVVPIGSTELLYANRRYQRWFGSGTEGHLRLLAVGGTAPPTTDGETPAPDAADNAPEGMEMQVRKKSAALHPDDDGQSSSAEVHVEKLDKWLEVRSRYLTWADGRLAQMVIATDITARRRAEELAAVQAERAENAGRLITMGEMASSVAHELNQPLSAISNYCSGLINRLRKNSAEPETVLKTLEKTAHQAQRAGQVIHRILSFVKKSRPNRIPSSIYSIVNEALELGEIEIRRRNVRLLHYVAAQMPPLLVDPILIEQVLINLIRNAAESIDRSRMPPPRRNVELRVVPHDRNGHPGVLFSVQDSGPGIPDDVREKLFEAFFSTKSDGMGIGLNLCRSIVESHMGRMSAMNLYNEGEICGCSFSFWLPFEVPADETARDHADKELI